MNPIQNLKYNQAEFEKFKGCLPKSKPEEQWLGHDVKKWWEYISAKLDQDFSEIVLPEKKVTREELKQLCHKNSKASDIECAISIMAWGGQNRKHGITLFKRFDEIQPIVQDMRGGRISPCEAYERFNTLWQKPEPLGMGAAYFTKLIFFCEPSHTGYIMDQWTSKSINLLMGKSLVHLASGHVSNQNPVSNYEQFCELINSIARQLGCSGEEVEIAMFSKGGHKKWPWRQHVINAGNRMKSSGS